MKKIVVGTDGSRHAEAAMRWAVDEARVHGAGVEIVLAWTMFDQYHADRSDRFDNTYDNGRAAATLAAWVDEILGDVADVAITQTVVNDVALRALLEAGEGADLTVLGARGHGGFDGLVLGSVSERVAQLATGPVAVLGHTAPVVGGRVVVGIDGSARARTAMRWAAAEARARCAQLDVVHAWRLPLLAAPPAVAVVPDFSTIEDARRKVLDSALADPALADVKVRGLLTRDAPARALIEQAKDANLVVVGTRGLGRVAGTLLGSVSRQLLQHAPAPVVVI